MRKTITLSVPVTCSQKWEQFTQTRQGGFCSTCNKNVVDFTRMNDHELFAFYKEKQGNTCGRFHTSQLERALQPILTTPVRRSNLMKFGALVFSLMLIGQPTMAQTTPLISSALQTAEQREMEAKNMTEAGYKIKGIVRSAEDNMPLAGANVWLRGKSVGTVTDADGKFEFPQLLNEGDVLIFSFVGMQSKEYVVTKPDNESQDIHMNIALDLGPIMMGTVMVADVYVEEPKGLVKIWNSLKSKF